MKYTFISICLIAMGSCTQQQNTLLQLEMYGEHEAALYVVTNDGQISFGGGTDALVGVTSFHRQLSDEQFDTLNSVIVKTKFEPEKIVGENRFAIRIEDEPRVETSLANEDASELFAYLESTIANRFDNLLDELPKPTTNIITDRTIEGERYKGSTDSIATQDEQ